MNSTTNPKPLYRDPDAALVLLALREARRRQRRVEDHRRRYGGVWDRILGRFVRKETGK